MARRLNHEGNFTLTKRGYYRGQVSLVTPDGKSHRFNRYGKTKAEARAKIVELVKSQETGVLSTKKAPTLAEYLLTWAQNADIKPSTRRARDLNRRRAIPVIGGILITKLSSEHIRKLDNQLAADRLSGASRNQAFDCVKTAMNQAVRDRLITASPFAHIDWAPPVAYKEMRFLTMREQAKLYGLNDEWTPVWQFLLSTGLRSGECFGLSWRQVDLEAGRISITQNISPKLGGWLLGTPKTPQSRRTLQISPEIVKVLRTIQARQKAEAERLGEFWDNPQEFVFTRDAGRPVLSDIALHALHRALDTAGVARCRVHDLRHTYAANHLNNGTPILALSRMLGHATAAFTLDRYGHLSTETQDAAASLSGRLLSEAMRMGESMAEVA